MAERGLLAVLTEFKRLLGQSASSPHFRVRTFSGDFKLQKAADGSSADYKAYSDYVMNAGLTYEVNSQCSADQEIDEQIHEAGSAGWVQSFHRRVVDCIGNMAGKMRMQYK